MSDKVSEQLMTRAERLMPGGVNSPVRAFGAVGGHPVFMTKAKGSRITGADGREYIDYVGSWGPAILGHAHGKVVEAVQQAAARGPSFGAPTEREVSSPRLIDGYPSIEMVRWSSSGTEATMSALRLARGFTGRDVIVKFDGAYHGHSDALLVKAGSGAATLRRAGLGRRAQAAWSRTPATVGYNDLGGAGKALPARRRAHRGGHRRAGGGQHGLRAAGAGLPRGDRAAVRRRTARSSSSTR